MKSRYTTVQIIFKCYYRVCNEALHVKIFYEEGLVADPTVSLLLLVHGKVWHDVDFVRVKEVFSYPAVVMRSRIISHIQRGLCIALMRCRIIPHIQPGLCIALMRSRIKHQGISLWYPRSRIIPYSQQGTDSNNLPYCKWLRHVKRNEMNFKYDVTNVNKNVENMSIQLYWQMLRK